MRKWIFTLTAGLLAFASVHAQDGKNAIGLRVGAGAELIYQRDLSPKNFLQFSLAFPGYNGLAVTGIYNWKCFQWDWTPQTCDWYLNAGVGGALGMYDFKDSGFMVGVAGSCAFGCMFKSVPISLDVNYRPVIGIVTGGGNKGFLSPGLWNFGITAAYHF